MLLVAEYARRPGTVHQSHALGRILTEVQMNSLLCNDCELAPMRSASVCAGCQAYEVTQNDRRLKRLIVIMSLIGLAACLIAGACL